MTVYAANLDFTLKEEEVREFFEKVFEFHSQLRLSFKANKLLLIKIGKVKEIRMPKDQFGKHKGYAYVELEDEVCHCCLVSLLFL